MLKPHQCIQVELDTLNSKIISQKDKVTEQDLLLKQEIESEINCFYEAKAKGNFIRSIVK